MFRTSEGGRIDPAVVRRMCDLQRHRGPDDSGLWQSPDGGVVLGHRRLSIIDLSRSGHQPMQTADGLFHVVFNGEIDNFSELRSELEELGHEFLSTSDTEVLLHGYRAWGVELLERLVGMFAFVLYDAERVPLLEVKQYMQMRLLREAARPAVPSELWERPKRGFSLPIADWLHGGEAPLEPPDHPMLYSAAVQRAKSDFLGGRARYGLYWMLLVLAPFLD